jgi:hypothetical protein
MPGFGLARMMTPVSRLCDAKARNTAERTLKPVVATIPGSDRRFREALEGSALCIGLRERQAAAVSDYLKRKRRF